MPLDLFFASDLRVGKEDPEMGNSLDIIIKQHQKPKKSLTPHVGIDLRKCLFDTVSSHIHTYLYRESLQVLTSIMDFTLF